MRKDFFDKDRCIMCDTYLSNYITNDCKGYCNKYDVEIENVLLQKCFNKEVE